MYDSLGAYRDSEPRLVSWRNKDLVERRRLCHQLASNIDSLILKLHYQHRDSAGFSLTRGSGDVILFVPVNFDTGR